MDRFRSETATKLQEVFGKKKQKMKSVSVDTSATSYSISENLEYVMPVATLSQLSQGEFVGIVADNFGEEINRKIFRGKIQIDKRTDAIKTAIPKVLDEDDDVDSLMDGNFNRIVEEIDILVATELYNIEFAQENETNTVSETA